VFPSWRHPFLAPLYAGVISFAFVVLIGAVLGPPPQTVIRVVADGADPLPPELAELSIEIRNPDGRNEKVGGGKLDKGSYTPDVPVANHLVCIQPPPPAPWMVTQPATKVVNQSNPVTCTEPIPNPPDREIVLKLVKGATVRAMADGPTPNDVPQEFAEVLVEIREQGGGAVTEMGPLDARGRWASRMPVGNRLVCLKPPPGWMVTAPPSAAPPAAPPGTRCATVSGDDIVFTLGRSQ
jgi:hypothetical protein